MHKLAAVLVCVAVHHGGATSPEVTGQEPFSSLRAEQALGSHYPAGLMWSDRSPSLNCSSILREGTPMNVFYKAWTERKSSGIFLVLLEMRTSCDRFVAVE